MRIEDQAAIPFFHRFSITGERDKVAKSLRRRFQKALHVETVAA
jgi:hypothetical protein